MPATLNYNDSEQVKQTFAQLDDDAGDLLAELGEGLLDLFAVVVVEGDGVFCQGDRNTGGGGLTQGEHAGARLHQQGVGMSVVAAFELDDLVPSGEASGQADRRHGGLGAGGDHAHQIHAGDQLADLVGHAALQFGGGAEA